MLDGGDFRARSARQRAALVVVEIALADSDRARVISISSSSSMNSRRAPASADRRVSRIASSLPRRDIGEMLLADGFTTSRCRAVQAHHMPSYALPGLTSMRRVPAVPQRVSDRLASSAEISTPLRREGISVSPGIFVEHVLIAVARVRLRNRTGSDHRAPKSVVERTRPRPSASFEQVAAARATLHYRP